MMPGTKFTLPYLHMETSLSSFTLLAAADRGFTHNAINMLTTGQKANTNKIVTYSSVS